MLQSVDKHNFGFLLHKKGKMFIQTAEAKMVFHYELPQRDINVNFTPINCSLLSVTRDALTCQALRPLLRKYRAFTLNAVNHLQNQLNNVYDILLHLPRKERLMKRGFWTDALSKITGLATKDEVSDVTSVLNRVEIGTQKAADAWRAGSSHF